MQVAGVPVPGFVRLRRPGGRGTVSWMASQEHILGIDEGTTGVRAAVVHESGALVASAYAEVGQFFPKPGWIEHDPSEIWERTREVIAAALGSAKLEAADLAAVGVTNQRGTAVLFDDAGRAFGPAIGWQDQRTTSRCEALLGEGLFIIPMAAGSKYEWLVQNHASDVSAQRLRVGTLDTWLAHCLSEGGVHATDHSNLSVSGLYDFLTGGWDERAVAALGLEEAWLPRRVETSEILGQTSTRAFGAEVPIASLSGDQHASMYALACHRPGNIKLTLGTSGMLDRNAGTELGAAPEGSYPLILWSLDGTRSFCFEGAVITAGATVQWLRDGLGLASDLGEVERLARSVDSAEGAWVVPAFAGLGSPHLDTAARALVGGVSRGTTQAHLARAALEGVAWRCAEAYGALVGPGATETLRVDGGAAANRLLLQLLADASGAVVECPAVLDSAAMGAAYLAGRAIGFWTDEEIRTRWSAAQSFEPRIDEAQREEGRERWARRVGLAREAGS